MPGFDGTGPGGQGPATGWGRGVCDPEPGPRTAFGVGRGGMPRGGGRGRCFGGGRSQGRRRQRAQKSWIGSPGSGRAPTDELDALRAHASLLEEQLQAIREQLSALEG